MATKPKKATKKTPTEPKESKRKTKASQEKDTGQEKPKTRKEKTKRRPLRRMFPIILRIVIIIALCITALVLGAMVGYGILGDGEPKDILNRETWQHIIDIVTKE